MVPSDASLGSREFHFAHLDNAQAMTTTHLKMKRDQHQGGPVFAKGFAEASPRFTPRFQRGQANAIGVGIRGYAGDLKEGANADCLYRGCRCCPPRAKDRARREVLKRLSITRMITAAVPAMSEIQSVLFS